MERIKPEKLPEVLTPKIIDILAHMAMEFPSSPEWRSIFHLLSEEDSRKVLDRVCLIQQQEEQKRKDALSEEERKDEERKRKEAIDNKDPRAFYGNMGQPETAQDYKNRYGVYPLGYDENGNKLEDE